MFINRAALVVLMWSGVVSPSYAAVKLSDLVSPCSIKDPQLNDCLTTQGRAMLPLLVPGVEDLGVVPIDPLFVPVMDIQRNGGAYGNLNCTLTNTTHLGFEQATINSIRFDPQSLVLKTDLFIPWYNLTGLYEIDGYVLLLPISGKGDLKKLFFEEFYFNSTYQMETENRAGEEYLKIVDTKSVSSFKQGVVELSNLFGNAYLSNIMNSLLSRNSQAVFEELKTEFNDVFSNITTTILSRMFAKIPYNQLFKGVD